jgi:4-amino-4-deoxy-L-arabinose transferase-like glycosyltransferase
MNNAISEPVERVVALRPWVLLAALGVALLWFGTLDARHLLRSDEGRYAEIAREMWASGDWVTPRYNELKYFEKPPFHLWMTALAYQAFGIGEWQARLWVALSGAAGLLLTMLAAWRWWGMRVAGLAGLVLLAAPSWNIASHFNSLDMSVSGALAAVLACTLLAQHPHNDAAARRRWMLLAWGAMAVAVLTKGLIGIVLPGLVLVVYTLWARDLQIWRRLHIAAGTLLLLIVTVPWFWLVSRRNPEFLHFFFIHEHFERYTSGVHRRAAPFWYFVPQLLGGMLPWLGLWPAMARQATQRSSDPGLRPTVLLAAWALAIFVFFSASSSKLPGYILPTMPALAILAALALDRLSSRAWSRYLLGALIVAVLLLVASLFVARLSPPDGADAVYRAYAPWLTAAAASIVVGVLLARWLQQRERQQASIWAYGLAMFIGTTIGLLGHETIGRGASGIDLVPKIQAVLKPGMPIYGVRLLDHTLPFYLHHPLVMVEAPDELDFGVQQEPQKWLPTLAAFRERWRSGAPALAVMSNDTYRELQAEALPMVTVAADARRVVVANFAGPAP